MSRSLEITLYPFIFSQVNMPMGDDDEEDEKVFYPLRCKIFSGKICVYLSVESVWMYFTTS